MAGRPIAPTDTSDGHYFGNSATDKIGFYGVTPVVQVSTFAALTAGPSTAEIVAAVNSCRAALRTLGLVA